MSSRLGRGRPNVPIVIRGVLDLATNANATIARTRSVTATGTRSDAADATVTRTRSVTASASRSDAADATVTRTRSVTASASATDPVRPPTVLVISDPSRALLARRIYDPVTVVVPPVEATTTADATITRVRSVTASASSVDPATTRPPVLVVQDLSRAYLARRIPDPVQLWTGQTEESTGTADATITRTRSVDASASATTPIQARPIVVQDHARAYRARYTTDPVTVVVPPVETGGAVSADATVTRTRSVTATGSRSDAAGATVTRTRSVTASAQTGTVANATITRTRSVTASATAAAPGTATATVTRTRTVTASASANSPINATLTRTRAVTASAAAVGVGGTITGHARATGTIRGGRRRR